MAKYSREFPQEVKENLDIVDVISEYVNLKKSGKNYKGLCPFHQEKTPSFTVNPENQYYYCFGCGAGGDVFNFLMEIENITFVKSLKLLARRAGLELPTQNEYQKKLNKKREKVFEIYKLTAKFYNYLLLEMDVGLRAVKYLQNRTFTRKEMNRFYLGYAPDRWRALLNFLTKKGYNKAELKKAGLILRSNKNGKYYDRFRGRVIFPIFNVRGEVLAFGGRIINSSDNSGPKYLNSPETLIYNKGDNLYGLNWARKTMRKTDSAVIMEGYTDILRAHKEGITNAVASLGTALTGEQARLLKRYASTVYIAYDADTAGAKATLRGLDILKEAGLTVKIVSLPSNMDPDDFIKEEGKTAFGELQENALNLVDFKIKQIIGDRDKVETEEKIALSRELVELIAGLNDSIEREIYLQKITDRLEISTDVLKERLKQLRREKKRNKKDKKYKDSYTKNVNKTNSSNNIIELERKILKAFIEYPGYRDSIISTIEPDFFSVSHQKVAEILWENSNRNIQYIIDNIDENLELKQRLTAFAVEEYEEITISLVQSWIRGLLENNKLEKKMEIFRELQADKKIELEDLNNLLVNFQALCKVFRKEGFK